MAKKAIEAVYKAKDDSEHPTPKAAAEHNKLVAAKRAFDEALESVVARLKESAMTADGVPFAPGVTDMWVVHKNWDGWPRIERLYIWPYHVRLDCNRRGDGKYELEVVQNDYDDKRMRRFQISELYASERAAQLEYLQACEDRVADFQQRLAKERIAINERPAL